eukprot:jgi/Tetstr1/425030/TSEL_001518.t1
MATPIVAGAALLARQYFQEGYYPTGAKRAAHKFDPSGALIKAVIIGGATPLAGFTEKGLPLAPTPSRRQGLRARHDGAEPPAGGRQAGLAQCRRFNPMLGRHFIESIFEMLRLLSVVDGAKLATGESHQYCVRANGGPMRITLVWHDLPSDIAAEKNPRQRSRPQACGQQGCRGVTLRGNGEEDRLNNVEQVAIDHVAAGQVRQNNPSVGASSTSGGCAVLVAVITIAPEMLSANGNPEFTFNTRSGSIPAEGMECRLGDSSSAAPSDTAPTDSTGAKSATDSTRGEEVEDSHAFVVDSSPPEIAVQTRPPVISSAQAATIEFSALDATTVSAGVPSGAAGWDP